MPSKNNAIYTAILALTPDLLELWPGDYRRFTATGFMDLHLDVLDVMQAAGENVIIIALSHNYRHPSGDVIPDPDMEIIICPGRCSAEAKSYQDCYTYRDVHDEDGNIDVTEQAAQNAFLLIWLTNIRSQGFVLAERKNHDE